MIGFVVLLTMLIMGWVFRSVVIAVTTALVNRLSAGAAFGVLVLTFRNWWAETLLGLPVDRSGHQLGPPVHLRHPVRAVDGLPRVRRRRDREARRAGQSTREADPRGIKRSAGTVTVAALVMVSVFAIFASLHMVEMKEIGVGLAVAVLIDALVVRDDRPAVADDDAGGAVQLVATTRPARSSRSHDAGAAKRLLVGQ